VIGKQGCILVLLAGWLATGCATTTADRRPAAPRLPIALAASTASAKETVIPLSAENLRVTFVGTAGLVSHQGEFERLQGEWTLATDAKESRLWTRVEIGSIRTKIGLLTTHLMRDDFLDVEQFPTATFASSRIEPAAPGPDRATHWITGDFTIHGVTKQVTFPARIVVSPDTATLDGTFTISQTAFGMATATEKTKDEVPVTVSIRTARR
jgi:polyisoprenoid-binding protein YceI